ncbi:MAG: NAD(P)H-hydrate epimerase [Pirellulales bacterium]
MATWRELAAKSLSTANIRRIDESAVRDYGMNSLVLMENAALQASGWLLDKFRFPPQVLILCGRGNNGGDGFAMARQLKAAGWPVKIAVPCPIETMSADAAANRRILCAGESATSVDCIEVDAVASDCQARVMQWIDEAEVIIDAMLGTGAGGAPREPLAGWIRAANRVRAMRVAVDIPTGLDAETGRCADPTFQAEVTLSFAARKRAFDVPAAREVTGEVVVLPIGIPSLLIDAALNWD